MQQVQQALLQYKLQHATYPESLDELKVDYFPNGVPKDQFTKDNYIYITDGRAFALVCYGKDGAPGGEHPSERDIMYTEQGSLTPYR